MGCGHAVLLVHPSPPLVRFSLSWAKSTIDSTIDKGQRTSIIGNPVNNDVKQLSFFE